MERRFYSRCTFLAATSLFGAGILSAAPLTQPVASIKPVTDTYFGTVVADPYRWMEDLKSPDVQTWAKAQNDYTRAYLDKLPGRDAMVKRFASLWNSSAKASLPWTCGKRYFYRRQEPGDESWKLYYRDGLAGKDRLLVDPQAVGAKGKRYTLGDYSPSPDGKFVAFVLAAGGGEIGDLRVINVDTGKVLPDSIDRVWFSFLSWDPGDKFFFYSRLKKLAPNEPEVDAYLDETANLHRLGDDASKDVVVLSRERDPEMGMIPADTPQVEITPGSPYAIALVGDEVKREMSLAVCPLAAAAQGNPVWSKFADPSADITALTVKDHDIWLLTYKDAPHFKILHLGLDHPDLAKADVAMASSDLVLRGVKAARDALYVTATRNGLGQVVRIPYGETTGKPLPLPFAGSVLGISANVLRDGCNLSLSGWIEPFQQFSYDATSNQVTDSHIEPKDPTDFSAYTSEEVSAAGVDGTPIPLSIIHKKGMKLDGQNPCFLYGYGAYGISISPGCDPSFNAWLEKGIVIAYAHVRGGGENGEDWHTAGQKLTKQNTIGDYISCAEYLIKQGWTSPGKLAGEGQSAGGILMGGALTQRPDLFSLAVLNVGIVNALRFETDPNGIGNIPEFGTVKDPDGFKGLMAMDAYHHVKDGTPYPTVLLITGANDPRVAPWESFKMTARLQAATSSKNPVLLRVDSDAGHGMGSSNSQFNLMQADIGSLILALAKKK